MILLVVGADRVDAGKTTFSTGLLDRTGAAGYKPRAGNDYWFDHDDCLMALSAGRLHGKDARRLADAEGDGRPPKTLNPVHRLWRPTPGGGSGLLGRTDREFVVDRITVDGEDEYVLNATAEVPDVVADALPLEAATRVESVEELNAVVERRHAPALDALATEITSRPLAVVESYGDVAMPSSAVVESYGDVAMPSSAVAETVVAAVAVVEPGRARIYRGDRYRRACEVARSSPVGGRLEKRVGDVVDFLEPVTRLPLPALSADERQDPGRIASAYADAYDALVSVAGEA